MELTIDNFFNLSFEELLQLTHLIFYSEDGSELDFSLLTNERFNNLCELLGACQKLSRLELHKHNLVKLSIEKIEKLANSITSCSNLEILNLSENNLHLLDLDSFIILARCLSNLTSLDLSWNKLGLNDNNFSIINSKILKYFSLRKLNLSYNKLSNNYLGVIKLFTNLNQITSLNLCENNLGNIIVPAVEHLLNHNNLEELDLSDNELGNSIKIFNFIMQSAKQVKQLNLSEDQLHLLGSNLNFTNFHCLESLSLSDNDFSLIKVQDFSNLIGYFATSNTLKALELNNIKLQFLTDYDVDNLFD